MTAVGGHVTPAPASQALLRAGAPGPGGVPRLADEVELLGEYKDSGYGSRRRWCGGPTGRSSRRRASAPRQDQSLPR